MIGVGSLLIERKTEKGPVSSACSSSMAALGAFFLLHLSPTHLRMCYTLQAISASANLAAGQSLMGGGPGGASRSGTPQVGRGSKAKDALWQRLGTCFEQVHGIVLATWHLQRMLAKSATPSPTSCSSTKSCRWVPA